MNKTRRQKWAYFGMNTDSFVHNTIMIVLKDSSFKEYVNQVMGNRIGGHL